MCVSGMGKGKKVDTTSTSGMILISSYFHKKQRGKKRKANQLNHVIEIILFRFQFFPVNVFIFSL